MSVHAHNEPSDPTLAALARLQREARFLKIGLALALSCITGVGFVMLKVKRFLDADLKASEDENNQP